MTNREKTRFCMLCERPFVARRDEYFLMNRQGRIPCGECNLTRYFKVLFIYFMCFIQGEIATTTL